ncbi:MULTISPECIES: PAS domain-containing protein [unclassified Arsukibacterium]|uniref:PAS domain-containing protein n=1 Tax=unclassified Arsukibacterium TaxID=2635278 RepID=UPI000C3B9081|nr:MULTISPECIES: PAS domain S-box protein [unclassified Arsukibacterium]MAA93641.1 hypothetical protein [Rheinheimera sp.]MBM33166.1 hypothetical protein [Rheinheimera sp.]HAW93794.1 hypothetical protein [Candidatus Azambacteria bacterium]|tara:strand:- start:62296 stop:62862 length:567 start_codon:yes stop_codon:yes gene_type:complete
MDAFELSQLQDAIVQSAVDAIIVIDQQGLICFFSPSAEKLFGYDAAQCIGQNVSMLMTRQHAAQHDSYVHNYNTSGKAKIIGIGRDVQAQRKDGTVFPMHLSVGESITGQGRIFVGVCHDLSEFKAVLERLISAEQRYRDIVQNQKEFICRLSKNSRLTFVNNAFSRQCQRKRWHAGPAQMTLSCYYH